jgi:hypothetical protein
MMTYNFTTILTDGEEIELKPNGRDTFVTHATLEEYI